MIENPNFEGTVLGILTHDQLSSVPHPETVLQVVTNSQQRPVIGYFPMPEETRGFEKGAKVRIIVLSPEQRGSGSPYKVELARQ